VVKELESLVEQRKTVQQGDGREGR
jgi:hypothetical protein